MIKVWTALCCITVCFAFIYLSDRSEIWTVFYCLTVHFMPSQQNSLWRHQTPGTENGPGVRFMPSQQSNLWRHQPPGTKNGPGVRFIPSQQSNLWRHEAPGTENGPGAVNEKILYVSLSEPGKEVRGETCASFPLVGSLLGLKPQRKVKPSYGSSSTLDSGECKVSVPLVGSLLGLKPQGKVDIESPFSTLEPDVCVISTPLVGSLLGLKPQRKVDKEMPYSTLESDVCLVSISLVGSLLEPKLQRKKVTKKNPSTLRSNMKVLERSTLGKTGGTRAVNISWADLKSGEFRLDRKLVFWFRKQKSKENMFSVQNQKKQSVRKQYCPRSTLEKTGGTRAVYISWAGLESGESHLNRKYMFWFREGRDGPKTRLSSAKNSAGIPEFCTEKAGGAGGVVSESASGGLIQRAESSAWPRSPGSGSERGEMARERSCHLNHRYSRRANQVSRTLAGFGGRCELFGHEVIACLSDVGSEEQSSGGRRHHVTGTLQTESRGNFRLDVCTFATILWPLFADDFDMFAAFD